MGVITSGDDPRIMERYSFSVIRPELHATLVNDEPIARWYHYLLFRFGLWLIKWSEE